MDTELKHNGHIFRFGRKAQKVKAEELEGRNVDTLKYHPYTIVLADDVERHLDDIRKLLSNAASSDYIFVIDLNIEADTDRWKGIIPNHIVVSNDTSATALMRFIYNHILRDSINHFDYCDFVEYVVRHPFVNAWRPSLKATSYIGNPPQSVFMSICCNTDDGIDNADLVNAASEYAKYLLDNDTEVICAIQNAQAASLEFICLYAHKPAP